MRRAQGWLSLVSTVTVCSWSIAAALAAEPCRIEVREKGTNWPVPLVELRTTHNVRFVTDNAGVIACDLPELLNRETWFYVNGHGYEVPKDGFGYRGVRLTPKAGATLRVEVTRTNIAKRLGRLTGAGLFAETQKCGGEADWTESGVFGCDSIQAATYHGRQFWLWGDTSVARYPLGVFDMTGATTAVGPWKSFEPPLRPNCQLFRDKDGHPRGVAKMPGKGPTWLTGVAVLRDAHDKEHLVAAYSKIEGHLDVYEWGLCEWNDQTENFEQLKVIWKKDSGKKKPDVPEGHTLIVKDDSGQSLLYFGNPLPKLRCPATYEAWQDSTKWERLSPPETLVAAADHTAVKPHTGSIAWNAYRQRYVTVFMQAFGKPSAFGELWYAEAKSPTGPWGPCVKILSHDNYTFYNPRIHTELTADKSPVLVFEGTYTAEFANKPFPTARYDYNQVLYRLDLDDPALSGARQDK